jgi:acetyl esterase/lipase
MSRTRVFRPALESLEGRIALAGAAGAAAGTLPIRSIPNIVYTRRAGAQQLDLFVPRGPAPEGGRPAVLAIPGGGWRWVRRSDMGAAVSTLAKYGYVVAVANYAFAGESPGSKVWPRNFEDVSDAVTWLRQNANRYGIDPNRIAAWGESAGGHLANLLGTHPLRPSSRVQAVVDFYGPTDLTSLYAESAQDRPFLNTFLGGSPAQVPTSYNDASPIRFVTPDDPPVLIYQGTVDKANPQSQSIRFAQELRQKGIPVKLVLLNGVPHGFRLSFMKGRVKLLPDILNFLDAALNHQGAGIG